MPAEARAEKTIAVVLYPGLTALDLVGPLQVLAALERFAPQFHIVVVAERIEPMETDVGMALTADRTFEEVPHPWAIVVPGGRAATLRALSDPVMRRYVETAAASAEIVASVCTGSLILASVGLLDRRRATTNWAFYKVLEQLGAGYVRERWVDDGRFVLSAGVSAGIDMALHLVARLTDEATARRVQEAVDYDPRPPFGGIDWSNLPVPARIARGAISLAAPFVAVKPRRLTRSARAARVERASAS